MERYQDYVIKNGKFVGKFEEMYQTFDNPWHQKDVVQNSYARHATLLSIKNSSVKSLIEVGCGLGTFTNYLVENLPGIKIGGMDVSETAIKKAKAKYVHIDFAQGDLRHFSEGLADERVCGGGYDAILFAEIMWYILEDLDEIIDNISINYKGKYIFINQTFYKGQQQYGNEYFTNLTEMINYLPWTNLTRIEIETFDTESVETHSVFRV